METHLNQLGGTDIHAGGTADLNKSRRRHRASAATRFDSLGTVPPLPLRPVSTFTKVHTERKSYMHTQRASIGSSIGAIVKSRSRHALSVFVFSLLTVFGIEAHAASTYYVDCSATTDGNGQSGTPWNSLLDPSAHMFVPGDALLFRKGVTCTGTLQPQGSGSSGVPITVGP